MPYATKAGGYIHINTSYAENAAMESVPGARWRAQEKPQGIWRCALAMTTCYALRGVFGDRLTMDNNLANWAASQNETWIKACTWLTQPTVLELPPSESIGPSTLHDAVAAFEAVDAVSDMHLKPYQAVAAVQMVLAKGAINSSEVGAGKTPTAIVGLKIAEQLGHDVWPLLLVCPNGLKRNWEREFAKWFPEKKCALIKGTASQKRKALEKVIDSEADVVLINYESLRTFSRSAGYGSIRLKRCTECGGDDCKPAACEVHDRELNRIPFCSVIADEAHRILDPKSKQSRTLMAAAKPAVFRWALTGTPISDTPVGLWSLLHFVAPKEHTTRTGYTERYVIKFFDPFGGIEFGGLEPAYEPELRKTLDARMIRHTKEQVLPFLPPKQYEIRTHELHREERAQYSALFKNLIADVRGGQVIAWNPLVHQTRLLQMSASMIEVDGDEVTPIEPSSKLDLLDDTLGDYSTEPVIVFFVSRKLLHLYEARLQKAKKNYVTIHGGVSEGDRDKAIQEFQGGSVDLILLTVGAGAEGITLTRSRIMVFVQCPWSLIQRIQAEGRGHRIGSEIHDKVKIIDLLAEETHESKVREALVEKGINLEEVVRDKDKMAELLCV